MPRARNLIVVSLHKSGTHLIDKVIRALGYQTVGESLGNGGPAWVFPTAGAASVSSPGADSSPNFFNQMPPDTAWFLQDIEIEQVAPAVVKEWTNTYSPPIIFNFRDPRDVLLSYIDYCLKPQLQSKGFAGNGRNLMVMDLLKNCPEDRRITVAIEFLDSYLAMFRNARWMLFHERILKTRFEDLVGPRGGGTTERQLQAIRKIQEHLGVQADADEVAAQAFDPNTRTFSTGRAQRWREKFSASEQAAFESKYGSLLQTFGYESTHSS